MCHACDTSKLLVKKIIKLLVNFFKNQAYTKIKKDTNNFNFQLLINVVLKIITLGKIMVFLI